MPTLDERIAAIEARLGPVPLAVPPITIGDLTNVPAPGSPIAAQWAQDASTRVVHVFASKAAIDAWTTAPNGCYAHDTGTGVLWYRIAGVWSQFTPWHATGIGIAAAAGQVVVASLTIPADPGPRTVSATCHLSLALFYGNQCYVELLVDNVQVAIANIPKTINLTGTGVNTQWNVCLAGNYNLPTGRAINVQTRVSPDVNTIGVYSTVAGPLYNRVDATVSPRGN